MAASGAAAAAATSQVVCQTSVSTDTNVPEVKLWRGDCEEDIEEAARALKAGLPVAFPTETVYGLGALAADDEAVARVFAAKGRPSDNPLIVHVADGAAGLRALAENGAPPPAALALGEAFWPGPLSICVRANPAAAGARARAGLATVAVRVPAHPVALALLKKVGEGVAAPSANASGRPSPTCAAHVLEDLGRPGSHVQHGAIAGVVDSGGGAEPSAAGFEPFSCAVGYESTVLDCSVEPPVILRPGKIGRAEIEAVLGYALAPDGAAGEAGVAPKAPGMKYRHYAPRARVEVVEIPAGAADGGRAALAARVAAALARGEAVGAMAPADALEEVRCAVARGEGGARAGCSGAEGLRDVIGGGAGGVAVLVRCGARCGDVDSVGRELFGALRAFDAHAVPVDTVLALAVDSRGAGAAILNRLRKAAAKDADELPPSQRPPGGV